MIEYNHCILCQEGPLTKFEYYASNGNIYKIKKILEDGNFDINVINKAILYSIVNLKLNIVEYLIDEFEIDRSYIFDFSIKEGALKVIELFIDKYNFNISGLYEDHLTLALRNNEIEIFCYLLTRGADIAQNDNSVLRYIVSNGWYNLDFIRTCIWLGADCHVNDEILLRKSILNGNLEITKFLIEEYNADINVLDNEPILLAIEYDQVKIVKYFVEELSYNIDKNILMHSIHVKNINISKYFLISKYFEIDIKDVKKCLLYSDNKEFIKFFLNYYVETNNVLNFNIDLLLALKFNDILLVEYYLQIGNFINEIYEIGALLSIYHGYTDILKCLIKFTNDNILFGSDCYTLAVLRNNNNTIDILKCLTDNGIKINKDKEINIVENVFYNKDLNVIKYLIDEHSINFYIIKDKINEYLNKNDDKDKEIIKYLNGIFLKKMYDKYDGENKECIICYNISTKQVKCKKCKNIFDNSCIEKWFEYNNTCVICRN